MAMKFDRPGMFKAHCRTVTTHRLDSLTEAELDRIRLDDGGVLSRWDRKLGGEVVQVPCALVTTDRAEFEQHMKDHHSGALNALYDGARPPGGYPAEIKTHQAVLPVKPWRPPSLKPEGRPFATTKTIAADLETCPTCGLVAQVIPTQESQLWWREHRKGCALATEAAAS